MAKKTNKGTGAATQTKATTAADTNPDKIERRQVPPKAPWRVFRSFDYRDFEDDLNWCADNGYAPKNILMKHAAAEGDDAELYIFIVVAELGGTAALTTGSNVQQPAR